MPIFQMYFWMKTMFLSFVCTSTLLANFQAFSVCITTLNRD